MFRGPAGGANPIPLYPPMKQAKHPLWLSLSALFALALSSSAIADDYRVVSMAVANAGSVTALRPAEQPRTVAVYPGRDRSSRHGTPMNEHELEVRRTQTANGGHVSYQAPRE
jgi:hypothetical protein